jgi:putative Mg2+ transporter-C (MgtC) family protein
MALSDLISQGASLRLDFGLYEAVVRLVLALVLGMLLGIDREARSKPAGLRSHMLVCLAAACLAIMTLGLVGSAESLSEHVRTDPIRMIEAVIAGVAFLGAGTIIRGEDGVKGITTGASLWLAGAIGIACGVGYYPLALITAALALFVLYVIGKAETKVAEISNSRKNEDSSS